MAATTAVAARKHPIQALMDNPWLLLFLGCAIIFISYTAWGWWDIATTPQATLP